MYNVWCVIHPWICVVHSGDNNWGTRDTWSAHAPLRSSNMSRKQDHNLPRTRKCQQWLLVVSHTREITAKTFRLLKTQKWDWILTFINIDACTSMTKLNLLKDTCTDDNSWDHDLCLQMVRTWELTEHHMMYTVHVCCCCVHVVYMCTLLLLLLCNISWGVRAAVTVGAHFPEYQWLAATLGYYSGQYLIANNKDKHYMCFCDHETSPCPVPPHPPHNIGHNPGTG